MNILFVCTGNTCRSAMAAALMAKIAEDNDMDVFVESAGIYATDGEMASENAILAMKKYNVDLSNHRSKSITEDLINESDLILTMTMAHKQMLEAVAGDKIYTLAEYAGYEYDVLDPYGGDAEEYEETAEEIYDMLVEVAEKIVDF